MGRTVCAPSTKYGVVHRRLRSCRKNDISSLVCCSCLTTCLMCGVKIVLFFYFFNFSRFCVIVHVIVP